MKKYRNLALVMAVCLTAVFYNACGSGNYESYNDAAPAANEFNSPKNTAGNSPQIMQSADGAAYEAAYDNADADIDYSDVYTTASSDEYAEIIENGFINAADEPVSTFSIDVDTASYANVRRIIQERYYDTVPADAVRIEEMINYFSYDYPEPSDGAPFSVTAEISECPWNSNNQLMLVGLQADKIDMENRAPMNLVFLIDVSGSMYGDDRLGLVQKAVSMLADTLNENDRISIVTYAGYESVLLEGTPGSDTSTIMNAINNLEAGGSTAGEAGIKKAYEIAEKYFIEGGNNRILLATDGDLNVGVSSADELKSLVEKERESGVNLSVLGFGYGNLKDNRLETLADNGNGNYSYIDSELEARKVLVQEMGGTLYTVAKDVKLQLAFNPELVESYRLIGYENRVLANEDFNNDKVDAGEIGAGHSVTALYEIIPTDCATGSLMTLSMRYKEPNGTQSLLKEYPFTFSEIHTQTSKNLSFAAAVTEFGMLLRNSSYAGTASYSQIQELLSQTDIQDEYRSEFKDLTTLAYQYGMLPEYVAPEDAPVPETVLQSGEEAQNSDSDFRVSGWYYNNTITSFPDPESFIALTELYLDNAAVTEPAENIEYFIDNGIDIEFEWPDKNAVPPTDNVFIFLADDETAQVMIAYAGASDFQCYELPKVIKDELILRLQMTE